MNTTPSQLSDDTVILRIIRDGVKYQGLTGDERTPANFQRRKLKKHDNKMEPGISVSISGMVSDETVLRSFTKDGSLNRALKLSECTIKELRISGFEVIPHPTRKNRAHAQLRCVKCDLNELDCFPKDDADCSLDSLEHQRDLADLFRPHEFVAS